MQTISFAWTSAVAQPWRRVAQTLASAIACLLTATGAHANECDVQLQRRVQCVGVAQPVDSVIFRLRG